MNTLRKLQPHPPLTREQTNKAAKQITEKNQTSIFDISEDDIANKARKKLDNSQSYYAKNKSWRKAAKVTSWICFGISLSGAVFGIGSLIEPNSFISWGLAFVSGIIALCIEIGFRYYSDKHYDDKFLYQERSTKYLVKFIGCAIATIIVSSCGIAIHYMNNHAPDPQLVEAKATLQETKEILETASLKHDKFEDRNTIKSGDWEGEVKDKMKSAVKESKEKVDNIRTEVMRLTKLTSGKKVLDEGYQNQVAYKALFFAIIYLLFAGLYIFCMRYMAYFDAESYKEKFPEEYLQKLAERNNQSINFH